MVLYVLTVIVSPYGTAQGIGRAGVARALHQLRHLGRNGGQRRARKGHLYTNISL